MLYVELVEGSVNNRGNFVKVQDVSVKPSQISGYTSMFLFNDETMKYVLNNISEKTKKPSVIGYTGAVGIRGLFIDVDMEKAPFQARVSEVMRLLTIMEVNHGITKEHYQVFFSGSKGFHIVIPYSVFSDSIVFTPYAGTVCRKVIADLIDIGFTDEAMRNSHVDFGTIHNTSIFRIPLTRHEKTGMFKIPVDIWELTEDELNDDSANARIRPGSEFIKRKYAKSESLKKLFDDALAAANTLAPTKANIIADDIDISIGHTSIFFVPRKGDNRNNELHRMAYRLYATLSLKDNEVYDIMRIIHNAVNKDATENGDDPITLTEFSKLMESAFAKAKKDFGFENKNIVNANDSLMSGIKTMFKQRRVKTHMPLFDRPRGGLRRQDYYLAVGCGGTYKSMIWLRCALLNAEAGVPCLYISGEMSEVQVASRIIYFKSGIDIEDRINSGNMDEGTATKLVQTFVNDLNNLRVVYDSNLRGQDLDAIIDNAEKIIGKKIELVVIDSLGSAFELGTNETAWLVSLSKDFKVIAKRRDVAVVALHHVSGEPDKFNRQPHLRARGGQKLIDNCDGYFDHSAIKDFQASSVDRPVEKKGFLYLSGEFRRENNAGIQDMVYELDGMTILNEIPLSQAKDYGIVFEEKLI